MMEKSGREGRNKGGTSVCQCLLPSLFPPSYVQPPGRKDGKLGGQVGPRLAAGSVLPLGPVALKQGTVRAPWGWTQAEGGTGLQSVLPPTRYCGSMWAEDGWEVHCVCPKDTVGLGWPGYGGGWGGWVLWAPAGRCWPGQGLAATPGDALGCLQYRGVACSSLMPQHCERACTVSVSLQLFLCLGDLAQRWLRGPQCHVLLINDWGPLWTVDERFELEAIKAVLVPAVVESEPVVQAGAGPH